MGVPVLTLIGQSFASRVCASLVTAVGLPELVCNSTEAYEQQAVELDTRPEMLRAFRDRLRAGRDSCVLFNMPYLVSRLESLYGQMWSEYLSDQIPEPDLTNLAIYAEIADGIDHETAEAFDPRSYVTALARRHSLSPVQFDGRMWVEAHREVAKPPETTASDLNKDQPKGANMMALSVVTKGSAANLVLK